MGLCTGSGLWFVPLALALTLIGAGCSSEIRLADVKGRVTQAGKLAPDLWVQFTPSKGGRSAEGLTNADGEYSLDFSHGRKGAPPGLHRVLVMSGGRLDEITGSEMTQRKVIFKGEFEVKSGPNVIDIEVP
jgi:hypothetical protein